MVVAEQEVRVLREDIELSKWTAHISEQRSEVAETEFDLLNTDAGADQVTQSLRTRDFLKIEVREAKNLSHRPNQSGSRPARYFGSS